MKLRALLVMSLSWQSNGVGARAQAALALRPYNGNDGHYLRTLTVRTAVACVPSSARAVMVHR